MKLTNQFTSPEQSERLLSAGLPEWTADSYYTRLGGPGHSWTGPILLTFSGDLVADVRKNEEYSARKNHTDPDGVLACWTTGRLTEIINTLDKSPDFVFHRPDVEKDGGYVQYAVRVIEDWIGYWDFKQPEV